MTITKYTTKIKKTKRYSEQSIDYDICLDCWHFKPHLKTYFKLKTTEAVVQRACNFIKKETLAQVFSYEFCEIPKNTFLYRTAPVTASETNFHWVFVEQRTKQKEKREEWWEEAKLFTRYSLFITFYSLLVTFYSLLIAF